MEGRCVTRAPLDRFLFKSKYDSMVHSGFYYITQININRAIILVWYGYARVIGYARKCPRETKINPNSYYDDHLDLMTTCPLPSIDFIDDL